MLPSPTKATCRWCAKPATNLIAFGFGEAGAIATLTSCDKPDCLVKSREQAMGDQNATITRLRNPAMLFHAERPGPPDHQPPFICASCRIGRHSSCDNQLVVRQRGVLEVVQCDCATVQRHQPPGLGGRY